MPVGSSRHVCRRREEGTEPELCQRLGQALLRQAAIQLAVCPGLCAPTLPGGPLRWVASPDWGEHLLLSPGVTGAPQGPRCVCAQSDGKVG